MHNNEFLSATPESVGIPSRAVTKFIRALREQELCMHGVLIIRRGKLIAECYAPPFDVNRRHRMYSISKSFTALGVGLMIGEGKIKLTDRIIDFYPEYAPGPVHSFIAQATVRDMLTMRDCHTETLSGLADWFSTPPSHPPGTIFMYNTTCTNLLCGIIEKISGGTLIDYLYPRLLTPIGFAPGCWCVKGDWGYSWSGSGIMATPRELARLALLFMRNGKWNGEQLISEEFIREATGFQTDNWIGGDDSVHAQGYGYQIWRTKFNGFGFFGMGSQLAVALPEEELLLVTTADTQSAAMGSSLVVKSFFDTVLESAAEKPLPEDAGAVSEMNEELKNMKLILPRGRCDSQTANKINGKTFNLFDNVNGWRNVRFDFDGGGGKMVYDTVRGLKEIPFGFGEHKGFVFPEPHYPGKIMRTPGGRGYEAFAGAAWADDTTLNIYCFLTDDHIGTLRITAAFNENNVTIYIKKAAEHFLDEYAGWIYGYSQ